MAKAKQTRRMIAMALAAAVAMSSVPVVAFAEDDTTVSGEGTTESPRVTLTVETKTDSNTGDTTHTETKVTESKETSENTTTVSVVTESTTSVTDATGAVTSTSQSSERVVSETTTGGSTSGSSVEEGTETTIEEKDGQSSPVEVPMIGEGVEPDHYDENGDPVFKNTDEADLPDPEVDGDEQQGENDPNYDYTVKEETPREVEVTITDSEVRYDKETDVYEGEQDLEFMTPVWDGKQVNLGGGTLDWFPGNPLDKTAEGYDYTPYGFMHNDVTHMWYIRTDKEGGMVDNDGNAVYYYNEADGTYSRNLPDEVEIYDIGNEKVKPLYYKTVSDTGEEIFTLIEGVDENGVANIEKVVNAANSMMVAFYDKTQKFTDDEWNAASDKLKSYMELKNEFSAKDTEYKAYEAERKAYEKAAVTPAKKESDAAKKASDAAKTELTKAQAALDKAKTETEMVAAQAKVDAAQAKYDAAAATYVEKSAAYDAVKATYDEIVGKRDAVTADKNEINASLSNIRGYLNDNGFLSYIDISRLSADYDDDGQVTQETKDVYNALFALLEEEKGKKQFEYPFIPAYCVDVNTGTVRGTWYELINAEDVGYYSTERTEENGYISDADRIKAIALNGYWGTKDAYSYVDKETGETVNVPGEEGSLSAMKAFFQKKLDAATEAGEDIGFTQADVDALTHGDALTITQHSIWRFGNSLDGAYMDGKTYAYGDEAARDARIDKFIEYFTTMPIDTNEFKESEVITAEKFIGEMSLTVGDRVEGHENNTDASSDNDAYHTDLSFSLVVTPGEGDDLVVSVVSGDQVLAKARIAGDGSNDDGSFASEDDFVVENGVYTFKNLALIENSDQTFSLNLEGAQYLEQGVYMFRSAGGEDASQTYTTVASGKKAVDLEMEIDFTFNVEEGSVKQTRKWKKTNSWNDGQGGGNDPKDPTPDPEDPNPTPKDPGMIIPDEDVPLAGVDPEEELADIADEEVPMADAPEEPMVLGAEEEAPLIAATGDSNHMAAGFGGMFAALAGMFFLRKKKED